MANFSRERIIEYCLPDSTTDLLVHKTVCDFVTSVGDRNEIMKLHHNWHLMLDQALSLGHLLIWLSSLSLIGQESCSGWRISLCSAGCPGLRPRGDGEQAELRKEAVGAPGLEDEGHHSPASLCHAQHHPHGGRWHRRLQWLHGQWKQKNV